MGDQSRRARIAGTVRQFIFVLLAVHCTIVTSCARPARLHHSLARHRPTCMSDHSGQTGVLQGMRRLRLAVALFACAPVLVTAPRPSRPPCRLLSGPRPPPSRKPRHHPPRPHPRLSLLLPPPHSTRHSTRPPTPRSSRRRSPPSPLFGFAGTRRANTLGLKPFRQGRELFLALALQGNRRERALPCGVAIVRVTDPLHPELVERLDGRSVGASDP